MPRLYWIMCYSWPSSWHPEVEDITVQPLDDNSIWVKTVTSKLAHLLLHLGHVLFNVSDKKFFIDQKSFRILLWHSNIVLVFQRRRILPLHPGRCVLPSGGLLDYPSRPSLQSWWRPPLILAHGWGSDHFPYILHTASDAAISSLLSSMKSSNHPDTSVFPPNHPIWRVTCHTFLPALQDALESFRASFKRHWRLFSICQKLLKRTKHKRGMVCRRKESASFQRLQRLRWQVTLGKENTQKNSWSTFTRYTGELKWTRSTYVPLLTQRGEELCSEIHQCKFSKVLRQQRSVKLNSSILSETLRVFKSSPDACICQEWHDVRVPCQAAGTTYLKAHFGSISNNRFIRRGPEYDISTLNLPEGSLCLPAIAAYIADEILERPIFKSPVGPTTRHSEDGLSSSQLSTLLRKKLCTPLPFPSCPRWEKLAHTLYPGRALHNFDQSFFSSKQWIFE